MEIRKVVDVEALRAYHAVESAAYDHDFVALPADPFEELLPLLGAEVEAGDLTLLYVGTDGGLPVGTLSLRLPTLDNLSNAALDLTVHPDHRRRGHGRRLLQAGIAEVRARGRSRIHLQVPSHSDGSDPQALVLMTEAGARPVLREDRRLLDLRRQAVGEPVPAPQGYRVVQWVDHVPDALVDGAAHLMGRMILDAPMGDMDYEQEKWDAARYRDKEQATVARNRTCLGTAVVHAGTGAVAGITDIGVNRDHPRVAYQWNTIVDPDHRGRGLGMVLKSWNHRLLAERVPEAEFVNTWNASSNTFMVGVNDALGFEVVERWTEWQLDL